MSEPHYVVFAGDVGTGKSTLVEKITGVKGRSSNARESFTTESKLFNTTNGQMIVNDTPGFNAMKNKLEHNMQIASALNWGPVSRIFLVVKADTRIDTTVDHVRKYAEQLIELIDILSVIVTHMDQVVWEDRDFTSALSGELGMESVIFSRPSQPGEILQRNMLSLCGRRFNLTMDDDDDTFFRLFKINNNNLKILRSTKKEVEVFKSMKREFDRLRKTIERQYEADLLFEFQAFMSDWIIKAQQRVSEENNFTFYNFRDPASAANEAGHIANMTNQLRAVLYDIRLETLNEGTVDHGVNELRRCPYCGEIWAKIGCNGETTCGNLMGTSDGRNAGQMATFTFQVRMTNVLESFNFSRSGFKRTKSAVTSTAPRPAGCGKTINWKAMNLVSVPEEFKEEVAVNTNDVSVLPRAASGIARNVRRGIKDLTEKMSFGN